MTSVPRFVAVLLLLVAVVFPAYAGAVCTGNICSTRSEAEAYLLANSTPSSLGSMKVVYEPYGPALYSNSASPWDGMMIAGRVDCGVNNPDYPFASCNSSPGWVYWVDSPALQCDELNDTQPPGPRLCLAQDCVPACRGGCSLDIVGDPLQTVPGRVQGQPVVYYRFAQQYTGETCEEAAEPDDQLTPNEDGRECNVSLGVCVDANGQNEYCTFNSDGTPSACVPAVDYDGDGVPDTDDTTPGDPNNGGDDGEGDESDNTAGGGATCNAAPTCSGDGIACAILYQTWSTRCAVDRLRVGTGPGTGPGDDDETGSFDPNVAAAQGSDPHPSIGDLTERGNDGTFSLTSLNPDGFSVSRTCPALSWPTLELGPVSVPYPGEQLCSWLSILASVILMVAYVQASYIVMRVGV